MIVDQNTPFQKALDAVESLPFDAREAVKAVRENRAKYGTVEELEKDLWVGDVHTILDKGISPRVQEGQSTVWNFIYC